MHNCIIALFSLLLLTGPSLYADTGACESASAYFTSFPPGAPELSSPANEMTDVPSTTTAIWHSLRHTATYNLQVSDSADFNALFINESELSDTSNVLTDLEHGTIYYWRVSAENVAGTGAFSPVWNFSTTGSVATPTFDPPPETYAAAQDVIISCSTSDATIYYTTNDSDPTESDAVYSSPIHISSTTTLKARAYKSGWLVSDVSSGLYTITLSAVDQENSQVPQSYALLPVYPNPFNPVATITYELPEQAMVSLVIFNSMGQSIRELATGIHKAGHFTVKWNGRDRYGNPVTSGLYICRFQTSNRVFSQKMLLMR